MSTGAGLADGDVVADRYRVHERVGAGGMGVVHRATDTRLKRVVALKQVVLRGLDPGEADVARRRTLREAEIAARVHHPRIVSLFDVLDDPRGPLLVLEYLPSRSLGALVSDIGVLTPGAAARVGAQVAEALAAAHAVGIVHRDVKPGNVLVAEGDPVGPVKLADFGISHVPGAHTLTSDGIGTPAYFAPEVARGGVPDTAADVYALGATLSAVAQGAPPFGWSGDNPLELIRRIATGPVPAPTIGGPLGELVARMIRDDPADRPTAADAVEQLWALADRAEPVHPAAATATAAPDDGRSPDARPSGWTPASSQPTHLPTGTVRPWYRRAPVIVAGALVVAVAITAGAIVAGRPDPAAPAPGAAPAPPAMPSTVGTVLVGDERTADPCLVDAAAPASFGRSTLRPDYGNLAACTVEVLQRGSDNYDVSVRWRPSSTDQPDGVSQRIGEVVLAREEASGDECRRSLVLSDGTRAEIDASFFGGQTPIAQPCVVAEAAAASAVRTLAERGVPRRPVPPGPFGTADACSLVTAADLAFLPPTQRNDAYRGFAGWTCDWSDGRDPELGVTLTFDRYSPPSETGRAVPGTPAFVRSQDDGDACSAEVPRREYTGSDGEPRADVLRVKVEGTGPNDRKCDIAARLVAAAAGRV